MELILQTSLDSRLLSASTFTSEPAESENPVVTSSSVEAQLDALKESNIDSFLDPSNEKMFEERGLLFSSAIDRIQNAEDLSSLLKLKDTQVPSFLARVWTGVYASLVRAHAFKLIQQHIKSNPGDYQGLISFVLVGLLITPSESENLP